MVQDPYRYFRPEARDIVDQFSKGVLDLEKGGSAAAVQRLLRLAHTLKGAARVVKETEIARHAHTIEDALSPYRDCADGVARAEIDAVLEHLDEIGSRLRTLAPAGGTEPPPQKPLHGDAARTVRTEIAEIDAVLDGVAEAHALLNGLRGAASSVEEARHGAEVIAAELASHGTAETGRHPAANTERLFALANDMRRTLDGAGRNLGVTGGRIDAELRQLREVAERLRLMPAASMFTALERTARDAARALGKDVTFEGKGGALRLDGHVIETVQDALIQIVRNAVAHGIEPRVARLAAGKPASGRIDVDVFRRGRHVVFACGDNGCGIDLDAVRRAAVERGVAGAGAADAGADELMRMLLRGGISTAKTVTDVSGRGVGLDVVRAATERLGGEVVLRSEPGRGTRFELVIPPLLAAIKALVIEAGGTTFALPLDAVRSTRRLAGLAVAASGACLLHEDRALAFIPLATALDGARRPAGAAAVIVAGACGLAAIGVDRIIGTARIIVRPLPQRLLAGSIVAGAAIDADSNPQLVLDPDRLAAAAHAGFVSEPDPAAERRPILVVDDSLTTRMLESSILESAGYDVDVAVSGEEALDRLRDKRFGLVLVDVEMPGMDGFTFIERIRADPDLRDIPALLVTSRASPQDRRRGREVGANGHICKSEFDQAALLAMIAPLMG